ncbi:MAG TPA: DUF1800 domain-containing protein [Verrucomicrobiae bacterium]|nr:DUF1800 domain-containing protein [Verrucomicrobiae bacterium]
MLKPLPASKWNYATAAHLYNRAGFGGTPDEIETLFKLGPEEAVSFFVDYEKIPGTDTRPEWAKPDPERNERIRQLQQMARDEDNSNKTEEEKRAEGEKRREMARDIRQEQYRHLEEMRGEWLKQMATGPRPFQEKLTLFWHGHFATSAIKVRDAYFMWLQIDTFRNMGEGNWLDLLEAVAKDPAMLIWLDQAQSRKEHANENFARECMELFTLGEGHYTEKDVTEAARAMTGWSLDRQTEEYRYRPFAHDNGIKTVLGRTGDLSGRDVLETIVAEPQAGRFIGGKLWKFFASDDPNPQLIEALAEVFRTNDNNFKPLLRTMFSSEEFYSNSVMRSQIKSPVQWLVGTIRLLQRPMPPPIVSTEMVKNLGQDLLMPPNVKGWDGGLSWITTNTLLARYNQAAILVMGQGKLGASGGGGPGQKMAAQFANAAARRMAPANVDEIVPETDRQDIEKLITALGKRFLQGQLTEKHRQILRDYLSPRSDLDDQDVRNAIRLLMSTPEYQIT